MEQEGEEGRLSGKQPKGVSWADHSGGLAGCVNLSEPTRMYIQNKQILLD